MAHLGSEEEKYLIRKAKEGNNRAFDELVSKYLGKSFSLALRYTNDEDDAKDVVQDTLLKVYNNLYRYNEQYPFSAWYYKILTNNCINFVKRVKMKRKAEDTLYQDLNTSGGTELDISPEEGFLTEEKVRLIEDGLMQISLKQRSAIILHDIEGFTQEETAKILGCPVGSVMSRLYYGRKKLKGILKHKLRF